MDCRKAQKTRRYIQRKHELRVAEVLEAENALFEKLLEIHEVEYRPEYFCTAPDTNDTINSADGLQAKDDDLPWAARVSLHDNDHDNNDDDRNSAGEVSNCAEILHDTANPTRLSAPHISAA